MPNWAEQDEVSSEMLCNQLPCFLLSHNINDPITSCMHLRTLFHIYSLLINFHNLFFDTQNNRNDEKIVFTAEKLNLLLRE